MPEASFHKRAWRYTVDALGKVGIVALKAVFWVCCGPCVLCALCFRRKRRRVGCVVGHHSEPPLRPTTPKPRARPLTLPLVEMQSGQKTFEQIQSVFIGKLPLEIRRMIYQEVLGGVTIKLRTANGKPVARRYPRDAESRKPYSPHQMNVRLAMLRTCRQIYSEAIEYLYSANTISVSTLDDEYPTIDYLSYYFLPQRLIQVRDLRIDWVLDSYYFDPRLFSANLPQYAAWKDSWAALQLMTGLRKLHIALHFRWGDIFSCYQKIWEGNETDMLEPVKSITAPAHFVLVLPDLRCSTDIDMGNSSCVLRLPARPEEPGSSTEAGNLQLD